MVSPSQSDLPSYLSQPALTQYNAWGEDGQDVTQQEERRRSNEAKVTRTKEYSLITKCIAEFLGDFTFVFIGTMQAYVPNKSNDDITHAALAHGFTIFIIVASLGHISGGHFNPAITWAVTAANRMPYWHLPFYFISQLLGGFCGALMSAVLQRHIRKPPAVNISEIVKSIEMMGTAFSNLQFELNHTAIEAILSSSQLTGTYAGATLLSPNNAWWEGLLSEALATYFLCHTVLMTAVDTDSNVLAPLAIGLTLSIDIFSTGAITGASMNPAR
ncbi:hypothetical protein WR25_12257 isoform D [Diploscapter pachys]|uniref:Aquaporin n=1 Tax=Diploscapter pachys TaxID=2018661 RepID=A0A2A2J6S4_9BILA|nr:hypothetical protein WR25_12257 isoform C [Diploscapter pachys]PAV57398.1 hypothetical protein WR25_12257 isoform D [Diploscapter pachys]